MAKGSRRKNGVAGRTVAGRFELSDRRIDK